MSDAPTISSLRLAILCMMLEAPKSGYDLKTVFEQTPMGHFSSSPGSIYPALKRMEEEGWISGTVENPDSLRPTRMLSLMPKGEQLLKHLFLQPIDEQDVVFRMDQLMLRFVFMTPLLGRESTCDFLEQLIEALTDQVVAVRTASRELTNDPPEGLLALQHGIDSYESTLRWARKALSTLTQHR